MSSPLPINTLLARHQAYLPSPYPFPTFAELAPAGKIPHVCVVTCADPRCIPEHFLGIDPDEIIIAENFALDRLVGIHEIMVVKHTDCGSLAFTEQWVKNVLGERAPERSKDIEEIEIGRITRKPLEEGLREQVRVVQSNELVRGEFK